MIFNSLQFLLFFGIVTLSYFSLKWNGRWILLLLASCYFYMVFVPEYIIILFATIIIDYLAGIWIENQKNPVKRKWLLTLSLVANVGILAFFKYFNFISENIEHVVHLLGSDTHVPRLGTDILPGILLPIGLSFHTFQAMSYTIEVYRGNQKAERHFGIYALYVMFYPQLVAGPIERPQNVLWQYHEYFRYDWENVKEGLIRMAWGLFKKVVIADRLAMVVDPAFGHITDHNGTSLLVAACFYSFQIYCDFSGYSDVAIGASKVMGFTLMENFKSPYEAASIAEFWRRWHISLSTWFRDYIYIPLGGSRVSPVRQYINRFIVFLVSGIWHGASWNFVIWGVLHGFYQTMGQLRDRFMDRQGITVPSASWYRGLQIVLTFGLITLTWVFFRAITLRDALLYFKGIASISVHDKLQTPLNANEMIFCLLLIGFLLWKENRYFQIPTRSNVKFWAIFSALVVSCYLFGVFTANQFIYFQF
ncbi:MBOAT family protein [Siphonobacter sp. SORGH_AS_0500]|uniref:MBOAT family O-acyltransferase n=1 Tax=Siphonobacter sp. SORGH_AS_0500 TaxID=1864824 RepID=UPI000CC467F5|nr:MBOAT family O-acyltransferase [Siphonobacter sp. SORGH_AS_0500]MDR6195007.1 alginate O-acetyltransferase complex protein AlgI [Siphonobacter sp. SORGH_AS_0500]PKK38451.1 membrane-bound O-acyltransferase family protein [Siphonobacter sp. SORGH_AS_0500]